MFSRFYRDTIPYKGPDGKEKKGKYLYQLKGAPNEILNYFKNNIRSEFKKYISD
jgi:hypothetical protein